MTVTNTVCAVSGCGESAEHPMHHGRDKLHDYVPQFAPRPKPRLIGVDATGGREQIEAIQAVLLERTQQDARWGGPAHDDEHTLDDWLRYIEEHVAEARRWYQIGSDSMLVRPLVQVAALCVAALEAEDRARRPREPV